MTQILGLNIEGGTVVACEGGEEGEITNKAIVHAQTSLTRHPPSPLPKSTLTQTDECHKITFRTH